MEIKVNSELKYLVDSIDGKESIPDEEVYIQDDQPEDGKIWIDTGELSNLGTEVVDSLEGNQTNKAPSVKAVKDKISSLPQGTITGIKMNGASKGTSGVVDLGTVLTSHQDISGKQDKLTTQTAYSAKGSATKVPQITTNTLGQVTGISEVTITQPTVNNATLTIQKNGSNIATFTANASSNVTANITVPTITDTYSSTSTNGMSGKAVASAISNIGIGYTQNVTNKACTKNKTNTLVSLTLPPGTYILIGTFKYEGNDLRYYFTVAGRSTSAYDKAGWVECTVADFQVPTTTTTYSAYLWPNDKDVTVNANLSAIRIK